MECTQRLDYDSSQSERLCVEQIGFLGILGEKYPVKRGPNKVGRDPQTCSIVLNRNSISRQHAVINVLSGNEYMLMDLDSANKTKLNNKTLQAYIPARLSNGDTVQFGEVFGVFRLLEEDTDLPCTQALDLPCTQVDVPETPAAARHVSRLAGATVPESPDVSDKDDSFIMPSQSKSFNQFKSPSNKIIKASPKSSLSLAASRKVTEIINKSSKKSFNLDDSNVTLNESVQNSDIHEMNTQVPNTDIINDSTDSIFSADTQIPPGCSPSIHSLNTQLPVLPAVCKISNQHEMEIDIYAANKENNISIFNADTQFIAEKSNKLRLTDDDNIFTASTQFPGAGSPNEDNNGIFTADTQNPEANSNRNIFTTDTQMPDDGSKNVFTADTQIPDNNINAADTQMPTKDFNISKDARSNSSKDEVIMFDELESQSFIDDMQSQAIVSSDPFTNQEEIEDEIPLSQPDTIIEDDETSETKETVPLKKKTRNNSNNSTDCEDIDFLPTQKIAQLPSKDDDLTDCEDELEDNYKAGNKNKPAKSPKVDFEDLATQVIAEDVVDNPVNHKSKTAAHVAKDADLEDMATQVIPEAPSFEDLPTQVLTEDTANKPDTETSFSEEILPSPFKVPKQMAIKSKKRDSGRLSDPKVSNVSAVLQKLSPNETNERYYAATQDILDDLCTQRDDSTSISNFVRDKSTDSEGDAKVAKFVKSLSTEQIEHVIGVDVAKVKKVPSDPTDVEVTTPKKVRPFKFAATELPDSQEIKTTVSLSSKILATDSSSESEPENDSQEHTPILFRKKKRSKANVKQDLTTKFDVTALPTRIITRTRKPTSKVQENEALKTGTNILKSKFLKEADDDVDTEIISENITRLKTKNDKKNLKDRDSPQHNETKPKSNEIKSEKTQNKTTSRRRQDKIKKEEYTSVDLTKIEVTDTKKVKIDSHGVIDCDAPQAEKRRHGRAKKYTTDQKESVESKVTVKEADSTKTTRETRRDRTNNKKDTQDKITNYTISLSDDSKSSVTTHSVNESLNSTSGTRRTRSTRSKNTEKQSGQKKERSESPTPFTKRKRGRPRKDETDRDKTKDKNETSIKHKEDKLESKEHTASSRSRRPRTRHQNESTVSVVHHEQSTVYNFSSESSESGTDSPKVLKRSRAGDVEVPSPKRIKTRSTASSRSRRPRTRHQNESTVSVVHHEQFTVYTFSSESSESGTDSPKVLKRSRAGDVEVPSPKRIKTRSTASSRSRRPRTRHQNESTVSVAHHEQFTVYTFSSESSESGTDSPKVLKRSRAGDVEVPSPKRIKTRSSASSTVVVSSDPGSTGSSRRSTPVAVKHCVLFTAFPYDNVKGELEKLGASVVSDVLSCTVLATVSLRRTFKLLCAVGLGRPVVGPQWLQACVDAGTILDPWQYILVDEASERRFGFSLVQTLRAVAAGTRFLRGVLVSSTTGVLPAAAEMKLIVECSGGTWRPLQPSIGCVSEGLWVVVSCTNDRPQWAALRRKGATIVSTEFILRGVLTQKLDLKGTALQ